MSKLGLTLTVTQINSPFGFLVCGFTPQGLAYLQFQSTVSEYLSVQEFANKHDLILSYKDQELADELEQFIPAFLSEGKAFEGELDLYGTEFQKLVWTSLQHISHGQTITYAEQSKSLGKPKAIRAIASANGANPIAILIPCHRVIGSDGSLTGYASGLDLKRKLLEMERAIRAEPQQGMLF
jgi:O-6-methylguanine DNA methyltransferase